MWRNLCGVDVRSLALFRICLGTVLLYDLYSRMWDLHAHFSDAGVLHRSTNLRHYTYLTPGLFNIDGTTFFAALLFLLSAVTTVSMLIGYRTFWATFATYILISSVHIRNLRVGNGGDKFLRHILLWSIFVPLNAVCSVDSLRARNISLHNWTEIVNEFRMQMFRKDDKNDQKTGEAKSNSNNNNNDSNKDYFSHLSVGSFALLLQTVVMYAVTWYLKNGEEWTTSYYAIYLTLCVNQWVTPAGLIIRQLAETFPVVFEALRLITMITPFLQIGAVLLFSPFFTAQLRLILIVLLAGFQLGLALCLDVLCVFPWVSAVGTLVFLPAVFWDFWPCIFPSLSTTNNKKKITSSTMDIIEKIIDKKSSSISSSSLYSSSSSYHSSWRYSGVLSNAVCVVFLAIHAASLLHTLQLIQLPSSAVHLGFVFQVNQDWNMFSNNLGGYDGWYSLPSKFALNGSVTDLAPAFTDMGIPLVVPAGDRVRCVAEMHQGESQWQCGLEPSGAERQHSKRFGGRWLELLNSNKPWTDPALYDFTDYLCRIWNSNRPPEERIAMFEILYVQRKLIVSPPGAPQEQVPDGWAPLERREFRSHSTTTRTRSFRLCETRCALEPPAKPY